MAAPANKTIGDLSGHWVLVKSLSTDTNDALALQGVGFLIRKTIGLATVHVVMKQYEAPPRPPSTSTVNVWHIDATQTAAKLSSQQEFKCVDGEWRPHSDWLWGSNRAYSRWVTEEDVKTWISEKHGAFVGEGWLTGPEECKGPGGTLFLYNHSENLDPKGGWTATQVWGFQMINGERRYVRRVAVQKDGKTEHIAMVYDWVGEE